MFALAAVLALWTVSTSRSRTVSPLLLGSVLVMAVVVVVSANHELRDRSDPFNGVNSRRTADAQAWQAFRDDKLFGAGIRYFASGHGTVIEPHSVVYSSLAESGLVGAAGLLVLVGFSASVLRRRSSTLALLALLALALRLIESLAAIFWVAGPGTILWLVIGLALGMSKPGVTVVPRGDRPSMD
jgi:hypothetical protein